MGPCGGTSIDLPVATRLARWSAKRCPALANVRSDSVVEPPESSEHGGFEIIGGRASTAKTVVGIGPSFEREVQVRWYEVVCAIFLLVVSLIFAFSLRSPREVTTTDMHRNTTSEDRITRPRVQAMATA